MHQKVANGNMPITKFKERIISELSYFPTELLDTIVPANQPPVQQYLEKIKVLADDQKDMYVVPKEKLM